MAACAGWRFLRPAADVSMIAGLALLNACSVEISQLVRVEWLDAIRSTRLGTLPLGRGFLWSDLLVCSVGTALATGIDAAGRRSSVLPAG